MNVIQAIGSIAMAKNARSMPRRTSSFGCPDIVRPKGCSLERSTDSADDAATKCGFGCAIISIKAGNTAGRLIEGKPNLTSFQWSDDILSRRRAGFAKN